MEQVVPDPVAESQGLPLTERLIHPHWRVRLVAYEELEKKLLEAIDSNAKIFSTTVPILKKIVEDKNVVSKEKGLGALLIWCERYDQAKRYTQSIAPSIVESLGGRTKTKELCTQLLLMFMYIDCVEPFVTALIEGAGNKVPKIASTSIFVIKEALKTYGIRVFPAKKVIVPLLTWFDHGNSDVRREASDLSKELYRWLGDVMRKHIESLRDSQVKELKQAFDNMPKETPVPLKYLLSQQEQDESQFSFEHDKSTEIDTYSLADSTDIIPLIKDSFYEGLVSKKWQERKEQSEMLLKLVDVPKLKVGDFTPLLRALKKALGDCNVRVVEDVIKCIGFIARGLRKDFSIFVKNLGIVLALLEKFQEKKSPVVLAIHESLGYMHPYSFTLLDIMNDFTEVCKSKVPHLKHQTLIFITKISKETPKASLTKCIKPLCSLLMTLMDDSDQKVREASYETFGEITGIVGERSVQGFLNQLDNIKLKKVKEKIPEKNTVFVPPIDEPPIITLEDLDSLPNKENTSEKAPEAKKSKEDRLTTNGKSSVNKNSGSRNFSTQTTSQNPNNNRRMTTRVGPNKEGGSQKSISRETLPPIKSRENSGKASNTSTEPTSQTSSGMLMNKNDVISYASQFIEESIIDQLRETSQWKARLEGISLLTEVVEGMDDETLGNHTEGIVALLQHYPSFSESIVQVLEKLLNLIMHLLTTSPNIPQHVASVIIEGLAEKIHVAKVKSYVNQILTEIAEKFSLQFLFSQIYRITINHKSPKTVCEFLDYILMVLPEFGIEGLNENQLVGYCKSMLETTNPSIKKAISQLLCELYKYMGPTIRDQLTDIKPILLTAINKEFDKIGDIKPPPPKRTSHNHIQEPSRVDISPLITPKLLESLNSSHINQRQQALMEINRFLVSANKKIQPQLGNLIPSLRDRITDVNKKITIQTLVLIADITTAIGPSMNVHLDMLIPSILKTFSDPQISPQAASCLDNFITEVSMEAIIPFLSETISSIHNRKDLLQWINIHVPNDVKEKKELPTLFKPTALCFTDKSMDVRKQAEILMVSILKTMEKKDIDLEMTSLPSLIVNPLNSIVSKVFNDSSLPSNLINDDPETEFLLRNNNNNKKDVREKLNQQSPWPLTKTQQSHINQLREQFKHCVSTEFHTKLFSPDVKKWLTCIDDLRGYLPSHKDRIVDNLDVLLKWMTWKLCETSTHAEKILLFLLDLFQMLLGIRYKLTDYEASVFLNIFLERVSGTTGKVRLTVCEILKLLQKIYPASKVVKGLISILSTTESCNVKILVLNELRSIVNQQGPRVCTLSSDLPTIVQCLNESDTSIQSAALLVCNTFYAQMGDQLWDYLEDITPLQRQLITKKIQEHQLQGTLHTLAKSKIPVLSQKGVTDTTTTDIDKPSDEPIHLSLSKNPPPSDLTEPLSSRSLSDLSTTNTTSGHTCSLYINRKQDPISPSEATLNAISNTNARSLESITTTTTSTTTSTTTTKSTLMEDKVGVLEHIEEWRKQLKQQCNNSNLQIQIYVQILDYIKVNESQLVPHVDKLVDLITEYMEDLFSNSNPSARLCKYIIKTMISIYEKKSLAKCVSECSLLATVKSLLIRLLDDRIPSREDGDAIRQSFNLLMLKILDNSDTTLCIVLLLKELRESIPLLTPENAGKPYPKYVTLVMKCLMKPTKNISSLISSLDISRLLNEIHLFFLRHPHSVWKDHDVTPLNFVKMLLHEIVKCKQRDVLHFLPSNANPSQLHTAIINILHQMNPQDGNSSLRKEEHSEGDVIGLIKKSEYGPLGNVSKEDVKKILSDTFKKIGNRHTSQQGLADLAVLIQCNPNLQIDRYLKCTMLQFQTYVEQGLKKFSGINIPQLIAGRLNKEDKENYDVRYSTDKTKSETVSKPTLQTADMMEMDTNQSRYVNPSFSERLRQVRERVSKTTVVPSLSLDSNTDIDQLRARLQTTESFGLSSLATQDTTVSLSLIKERMAKINQKNDV